MRAPISPRTTLCGIVLHPAGHTRSPAMHNAAYEALGLDAAYHAFDVKPDDLHAAMAGVRALGLRQVSVSIPHKQAVIAHLDEIDDTAHAIGAVNTVTREGDRLLGANTDWIGAVLAIERIEPIAGKRAVVLGAGGAARALVYGLQARGAEVSVLNRSVERARELQRDLGAARSGSLAELADHPHDILVNTTSVGLRSDESPVDAGYIAEAAIVMDAVYDPAETRLLRDAAARGATTIPGKWMLVYQAAAQLMLWCDVEPPIEAMAEAFDRAGLD